MKVLICTNSMHSRQRIHRFYQNFPTEALKAIYGLVINKFLFLLFSNRYEAKFSIQNLRKINSFFIILMTEAKSFIL